jgi:hypothetical protein
VLADLTGKSEAQDARIAQLLGDKSPDHLLRGQLKLLLASSLKARVHARRMLKSMAAKAKSPALVEAIRNLDPELVESQPAKK